FEAARILYEEERVPESQPLLQRLLEDPRSTYRAEAAVGLAEPRFEAGDMPGALRDYERVLAYPDSPFFGYAIYKIGWAHFNLHEKDKAIAAFERVIELGEKGQLPPGDAALLVAECRKSLARMH